MQTCDVAGLRDIARKLVQLAGERDLARIRTRVRRKASPVVEYNVYRGTQSGGPYQRLNLSPQPDNSYTDGTVQSGLTYFYVATAVGTTWSRAGIPMRPRPQFPDLLINQLRRMERVSCSAHVGGENSKSVERLSASKRNSPFIFLRHNGRSLKLPLDLQVRIIPCQRAFRCGVVIVAGFVEDVSIF